MKIKKVKSLSHVQLFVTPRTVAYETPWSMGFSRQEYWSGLSFTSPGDLPDPGRKLHCRQTLYHLSHQFSSVQSLSCVQLFSTPWTAACQASLSITNSQSLLRLMSIELMMPSNRLTLCCLSLLLPSIFPSIMVFSNESALHFRWPKYWSSSFSISPSREIFRTDFLYD